MYPPAPSQLYAIPRISAVLSWNWYCANPSEPGSIMPEMPRMIAATSPGPSTNRPSCFDRWTSRSRCAAVAESRGPTIVGASLTPMSIAAASCAVVCSISLRLSSSSSMSRSTWSLTAVASGRGGGSPSEPGFRDAEAAQADEEDRRDEHVGRVHPTRDFLLEPESLALRVAPGDEGDDEEVHPKSRRERARLEAFRHSLPPRACRADIPHPLLFVFDN